MWRWPVVERKKNISNAAKAKVYAIHAKLISLAAQKWWDPNLNPSLYDAIEKARKDSVPADNITRAIKKWTWEDKDWSQIEQIVYEWYWVAWVWVLVTTVTDNRNRTVANIRHIFTRFWGNLWESWSLKFVFERKWLIFIDLEKYSSDELEWLVFETEVEDYLVEDGLFKVITTLENFATVKSFFNEKWIELSFADLDYIPNNEMEVTDFDNALKLTKMLDAFKEDEDVEKITVNMIISDELQKEVDEFIEKNTFRT